MTIADFLTDVNDTVNRKAEDVVYTAICGYFPSEHFDVHDLRALHKKWDFTVFRRRDRRTFTVDVKCDHYVEGTKRFAFEMFHIFDDGRIESSWGLNPRLHFIALIPDTLRWIRVLPMHYVRSYVALMQRLHTTESLLEHKGWKEIQKQNRGRGAGWITYGWAVPLEEIEAYCDMQGAKVYHLETPKHVHRHTGPRLLINGREVA